VFFGQGNHSIKDVEKFYNVSKLIGQDQRRRTHLSPRQRMGTHPCLMDITPKKAVTNNYPFDGGGIMPQSMYGSWIF